MSTGINGHCLFETSIAVLYSRRKQISNAVYLLHQEEEMDNVPALRRKLQRVQVSNLNLTRELERAERMLKAQVYLYE